MGKLESYNDVIFTCICKEPEGDIIRTVKMFSFTPENLRILYNKILPFGVFMGCEIKNFEDLLKFFVTQDSNGNLIPKGLAMCVDDFVGIFYLTDISPDLIEASVHYTFFDRRHKGRSELCKKALAYTFESFQFHRLWTQVPSFATNISLFIEGLGFVKEGRLRKNKIGRGKFYDTIIFGLLKEEFKWEPRQTQAITQVK